MTGLDTNIVLRYLLQDDPAQTKLVNRLMDRLSAAQPGFISVATALEIVWVLRSVYKFTPAKIADTIEELLSAEGLEFQNGQQVFEAAYSMKQGSAEFEDALIGALNTWAGCSHTLTFDRKASQLHRYRLLV